MDVKEEKRSVVTDQTELSDKSPVVDRLVLHELDLRHGMLNDTVQFAGHSSDTVRTNLSGQRVQEVVHES